MLDLLYLLVKYGYYDDLRDINKLIPPLVSLLNGKNDRPHPDANSVASEPFRDVRNWLLYTILYVLDLQEGRFEDNHINRAVFNMKIKALKIMDLFFNYRFYIRLQVNTY